MPPKVPMLGMPMGVASNVFGEAPTPPPGAPGLFALAPPGLLERAFADAGFVNVQSQTATLQLDLSSGEEYTNMVLDLAAPITTLVERHTADRQRQFREALARAAGEYATPSGTISMANSALCVAGQRPE